MGSLFTESPEERDRRVDALLRDMVVEEALLAMEEDRPPRSFTLTEVADYTGIGFETFRRMESEVMSKVKKIMIR